MGISAMSITVVSVTRLILSNPSIITCSNQKIHQKSSSIINPSSKFESSPVLACILRVILRVIFQPALFWWGKNLRSIWLVNAPQVPRNVMWLVVTPGFFSGKITSGLWMIVVDDIWMICGLYVDYMWIIYGLYMDDIWIICGLYMDYMWIIYGLYVDYMWIICGLYMDDCCGFKKWMSIVDVHCGLLVYSIHIHNYILSII